MSNEKTEVVIASPSPAGAKGSSSKRDAQRNQQKTAEAWLFFGVLRQRWPWMIVGGVVFALLGFAAAWMLFKPSYIASAQLIRNDSPRSAQVFSYQTLTPQTFVSLLHSPELIARVAEQASPPMPVDKFAKRMRLTPERDGDVVVVEVLAPTKQAAVDLANIYSTEAVRFTQQLQARAAEEVKGFITPQIVQIEADISDLKNRERPLPKSVPNSAPARPSPLLLKLQTAREEVVDALTRYTDTHPAVQAARAKMESLERQLTNSPPPISLPTEGELAGQLAVQRDAWELLRAELHPLETTRRDLMTRRSAAELLSSQPPGYYRVFAPAAMRDVKGNNRGMKIIAVSAVFGVLGFGCFALLALFVELLDNRIKAPADVTRVTGLPLIATAPDLETASQAEQRDWAFRTWTKLQGRLSPSLNHGLVCGVTSAAHGEGRSTWIKLLARAASENGFRVLTVTARHPGMNGEVHPTNGKATNGHGHQVPAVNALDTLLSPIEVEDKLVGPQSQPVVHIPLPGWVWSLERRKQWQSALERWRKIENIVILIELPPASVPESVLLAQELPNLIWLTNCKSSKAAETRTQLETLRSARCRLVGAVMNRAPEDRLRTRFARWLSCGVLLLGCASIANAQLGSNSLINARPPERTYNAPTTRPLVVTATTNASSQPTIVVTRPEVARPPAPQAAVATPVTTKPATEAAPVQLALNNVLTVTNAVPTPTPNSGWQKKFTLGAGDVVTIQLYGMPEFIKRDAVIGPDGRISYMEASDIKAAGLTIDEFRLRLDDELGKYRRAPRTMVTPILLRSKKYTVLGKVNQRGVFSMEHPTTILEAVARARGFEVGLRERDSIDLVDLQRSFLLRGNQRIPVNFEKMFLDGDFSQNIVIEPDDYLFFPAMSLREIHVLGEVRYPGTVTWTESSSVIAVIAQRAGFNDQAFKSKVLVIRGGLNNPEKFVVDTNEVLEGKRPDFRLQPKDIVYVAKRPWWRAEDLMDLAMTAFSQSVVSSWVGQDLVPPFKAD